MVAQDMLALGMNASCIRELFEYGLKRAKEIGKENVYDYSLGNPSIPSPQEVTRSLLELVGNTNPLALHSYSPAKGFPEVRKAVAEELNSRYKTAVDPDHVFMTCGAAPALVSVLKALAVPEADVIVNAPYFPDYKVFTQFNGIRMNLIPADTSTFQLNLTAIESAIGPHTQAIIVNSPNNPSGVIYTEDSLRELGKILTQKGAEFGHPIYLISDEPYRELVYDQAKLPFMPALYDNTVICYSYSKSLSLPGERIGYVYVSERAENADTLFAAISGAARVCGHVCAPSLMQLIIGWCTNVRPDIKAYDRNRKTLYENLRSYGYEMVLPQGAFYLFVKAPNGNAAVFSDMAKAKDLLIVPGGDFGCPEYFRISTCVSHDMILRSLPVFKELITQC